MRIAVDSPRMSLMKNQTKALSFTLVQADENEEFQAIPGFRVMDGHIHPPCVYKKQLRKWVPLYAASRAIAVKIYAAVVKKDWMTEYELPPLEDEAHAVTDLILTPTIASRVAPNCLV